MYAFISSVGLPSVQQLPPPLQVGQPPLPQAGLATVQECNSSSSSSAGSTVGSTIGPSVGGNSATKRLQGHPLKSFSVPAPPPPPQSAPCTPQQKHIGIYYVNLCFFFSEWSIQNPVYHIRLY